MYYVPCLSNNLKVLRCRDYKIVVVPSELFLSLEAALKERVIYASVHSFHSRAKWIGRRAAAGGGLTVFLPFV